MCNQTKRMFNILKTCLKMVRQDVSIARQVTSYYHCLHILHLVYSVYQNTHIHLLKHEIKYVYIIFCHLPDFTQCTAFTPSVKKKRVNSVQLSWQFTSIIAKLQSC